MSLGPIDTDERLHALDILRGLALSGMILVHFHQRMRLPATGFEDLIGWAVWTLVEQKAWGVFAFLFGVGFAVLLRRLEARSAPVLPIYLRRLGTLAVFGVVAAVGFGFDILLSYACWGFVLLVVRRWSTRALFVAAAFATCVRPVLSTGLALYGIPLPPRAGQTLAEAVEMAAQHGGYAALFAARWSAFLGGLPHTWADLLPDANLTLFILGLLAVRHRVLDEPRRHARLVSGWMIFGACAWAAWWLALRHWPAASLGLAEDQWLCLTYVGAVVLLLAHRPAWRARLAPFGCAGRLALTNYMVQAIVLDAASSAYGLELKLRPYAYVVGAAILFSAEAAFSAAWLARYRFGPLEWVWRTITYARLQPLRRLTAR